MGLESGTYIDDLDASNPAAGDPRHQGDDHIRLIKQVLKASFPDVSGPIRFGSVEAISANKAVASTDANQHYVVDTTSGHITVTMPNTAGLPAGWSVRVTKGVSHANDVILESATTINGLDSVTLTETFETARIIWTGTMWLALDTSPFYTRAEIDALLAAINAAKASKTQTEMWAWYIPYPTNQDYRLVINVPYGAVIQSVTTKTTSGTATVTGKINSTVLGGTANAASSVEQTQNHATANTLAVGDDLTFTVSSAASPVGLNIVVKLQRTLAT